MNGEEVISKLIERYPNTYRNEQKYYVALSLKDSEGNNRNVCEIKNKPTLKKVEIVLASKHLKDEQVHRVILNPKAKEHQLVKNASFFIITEDDYNNNLDLFDSLYEKTLESIKLDEIKKNSTNNEMIFKEWIRKYKASKNKKDNEWLSVDAKRNWLKGEPIESDLVDFMPIKQLLLSIELLSDEEKINIEKLPNNLFTLSEDKFTEAKSVIDEVYSNHKEELVAVIEKTNKDNSQNASYSTFKPTNFAKEYLLALQNQGILEDTNRTKEEVKPFSSYASKLISSKNIIFRGAPGTGKTYLAGQIASEIVSNKRTKNYSELTSDEKERIGFVQFHPNYDYTDFVEGYRPVMSENNSNEQMGFELIDGVFKKFVNNAKKSQFSGGVDNFDEAWAKFFEKVTEKRDEDLTYNMKTLKGKDMHLLSYINNGNEGVTEANQNGNYYNKEQCYKVYQGKPGVPKGGFDNYRKAIVQHLKEVYGLLDFVPKEDKNLGESFVFIIDEINRGEMSKIFGELFFSIDPGYRGKKGTVQTQYSAVQNPDDAEFYVPENVYILGTMNDIDRSVESFDFAMRRRFRFIEIKADDESQLKMLEQLDDFEMAKTRLLSLNYFISNIDGLNSHYHVGPSYFLKLKDLNYDYELLWSDYIAPLLEEYIRGFYNEEELMESLKLAYDLDDELGEE
ncbi:McrB family protein [Macrococcus animalis]|uniref:McrB family protein n=1 Tax=Macrococcus animalis TaxID=3395467 RepID=UPI0039BE0157